MLESEIGIGIPEVTKKVSLETRASQTGQIIVHTVTIIIYKDLFMYLAASVLVVAETPVGSQAQAQAQQLHCVGLVAPQCVECSSQPGIKHTPPALQSTILKHWTLASSPPPGHIIALADAEVYV